MEYKTQPKGTELQATSWTREENEETKAGPTPAFPEMHSPLFFLDGSPETSASMAVRGLHSSFSPSSKSCSPAVHYFGSKSRNR